MRTFTAHTIATSAPREVVQLLTDPDAIARWAPIPFQVLEFDKHRLYPGAEVRVRGQLAGQSAEFSVHVLEVSDERLTLVAQGPISLEVEYDVRPASRGSAIRASVSVIGHGLIGRLLAKATEALLAAGALQSSLNRLANQLAPAIAA
jgi:polyketide cyclase/dehydrase/lipid transport protein